MSDRASQANAVLSRAAERSYEEARISDNSNCGGICARGGGISAQCGMSSTVTAIRGAVVTKHREAAVTRHRGAPHTKTVGHTQNMHAKAPKRTTREKYCGRKLRRQYQWHYKDLKSTGLIMRCCEHYLYWE